MYRNNLEEFMEVINASSFTGKTAWQALDIAQIEGATVRLHWTDKPYIWHENDGDEVFIVLDGRISMMYRDNGAETKRLLLPGDICYLRKGEEHVASPEGGPARVLVIEKKGSI